MRQSTTHRPHTLPCALAAMACAFAAHSAEVEVTPVDSGSTLTFEVGRGDTATYAGNITGSKSVVKNGAGTLTLTGANDFTGTITVNGGILKAAPLTAFGKPLNNVDGARVTIAAGAAVDLSGPSSSDWTATLARKFTISGSGPDGYGAIRRMGTSSSVPGMQNNPHFNTGTITLAGDAAICSESVTTGWGIIVPNGHTLTKDGAGTWLLNASPQPNGGNGGIRLATGTLAIQPFGLGGDANNYLKLASGTTLDLYGSHTGVVLPWLLDVEAAATISTHVNTSSPDETKYNIWSGPVAIGTGNLSVTAQDYVTFSGFVTNAAGYGKSIVMNGSGKLIFTGGAQLTPSTPVTLDGTIRPGSGGTVLLGGGKEYKLGYISVANAGGTLILTNSGTTVVAPAATYIRGSRDKVSRLVINSGAALSTSTWPLLAAELANCWSWFEMAGNGSSATVGKALFAAQNTYQVANTNRHAAGFQSGGTLSTEAVKIGECATSHGFYDLSGGELKASRYTEVGTGCDGLFYQSGGTASVGSMTLAATGGVGVVWQSGGSMSASAYNAFWYDSAPGSFAVHAVEGHGTSFSTSGHYSFTAAGAATNVLSIADGALFSAPRIVKSEASSATGLAPRTGDGKFFVNLDGGTVESTYPGDLSHGNSAYGPDEWIVQSGGVTFNTSNNNFGVSRPLCAPTGKIVSSIALSAAAGADNKYIGAPAVMIHGKGRGAAAVALFDKATRKVTGIRVVSKGSGYDENTTATMRTSEGTNSVHTLAVTLADAPTTGAGLRLVGLNTFTLPGGNTYKGPTTVEGGTLKLASADSLPAGTDITVGGTGLLDLNGKANPEVARLTCAGGGISGGSITVTDSLAFTMASNKTTVVAGSVTLRPGASISLSGSYADLDAHNKNILMTADQIICEGAVSIPSLARPWTLYVADGKIYAVFQRGTLMIFR